MKGSYDGIKKINHNTLHILCIGAFLVCFIQDQALLCIFEFQIHICIFGYQKKYESCPIWRYADFKRSAQLS